MVDKKLLCLFTTDRLPWKCRAEVEVEVEEEMKKKEPEKL
jgi:hypothetical protein